MRLVTRQRPFITAGQKGPLFNENSGALIESTAGAVIYTAAELSSLLILRDPNGAARTDVTPSAAALIAADPGAIPGTSFRFSVRNTADAAETITMSGGTGVTTSGTMTITQGSVKQFMMVLTGPATCTLYSLGTAVA